MEIAHGSPMVPGALKFLSPRPKLGSPATKFASLLLLLRAMKNLLGVPCVICLNEQIKRSQATGDRGKYRFSTFI